MVSDKLKQIIFKQLYKELSKVEIIPYKGSIYFIDRDKKYWYFEYEKSGMLWWRYDFFINFFLIFSLEYKDYQKIMGDWVEEVLNCKVNTICQRCSGWRNKVEEVLNCKVNTIDYPAIESNWVVEEVLNCKVNTITHHISKFSKQVEEVLNHKVNN